jgi:anti-sigma regulatory factor (Ser/Thr protein kinase)
MAHLDAAVRTMTDSLIVTCVYAVHDAERQTLTYANAGHLPPLLTPAGAATRWLEVGDPPLGTGHYQGSVETVGFGHGDRLTLYTDGLVEHRGSDISAGISRFAELLDSSRGPVEALPSLIAAALLPPAPDDDVAILVATARPRERGPVALSLPSVETSVEAARRAVSTALEDAGVDEEVRCDALLLVSELVTNAIRHGSPPVELRVRCDDACLIITVSDGSTAAPAPRPLDPHTLGGRGLALVDLLTADWGSHPTGSGKTVWCVIPLPHRLA